MKQSLIILYFFNILIACNNKPEPETKIEKKGSENIVELNEAQLKNAGIATGKPEQKAMSSILKVNGSIDVPPQNMVSVSVPLGGYLKSTKLLPGMHLSKGEVIAVIEDQQYIQLQQEYLTAGAKLAFVESEYNRQRDLNESKATSDKVFQQTESDYKGLKILRRSLFEKLRLININPDKLTDNTISRSISIYSPIDGYVSKVNVNIGKYVNPADVLFELVNPTDIHLALNIYEKDVNKLFIGQKLVAYTNNEPDKKYNCRIMLIGKDISPERSVEVHCHFDKYDKSLIPGMFMNAEIEVKSDNANVLPEASVVHYKNKDYVFLVKGNNQFEILEVKTGTTENGYTEIIFTDAQKFSDQSFVTKGGYSLLMKMKNTADE